VHFTPLSEQGQRTENPQGRLLPAVELNNCQ